MWVWDMTFGIDFLFVVEQDQSEIVSRDHEDILVY